MSSFSSSRTAVSGVQTVTNVPASPSTALVLRQTPVRYKVMLPRAPRVKPQPHFITRLAKIPWHLLSFSSQSPKDKAVNLLSGDKKSFWGTGGGNNHEIRLELDYACLLGFMQICNRSTSYVEIAVSMKNEESSFCTVVSDSCVPHNKTISYNVGFLPCRYLRLRCIRGTPVSAYWLRMIGLPLERSREVLGFAMNKMLVTEPSRLLMNVDVQPRIRSDMRHQQAVFPMSQVVKDRPYGLAQRWEREPGKMHMCIH